MMRLLTPLLGLLALFVSGGAQAGALDDLRSFYREVDGLHTHFEQRLLDEEGDTLERYAGEFWLDRPGRFFWEYQSPYPLELGSDGQSLWHYDVDLKQITLRDADASLSGTPAELLGGNVEQLDAYELEELPPQDGVQWLRLVPRSDDSDFSDIRIGLKDGQPQHIELDDRLGQTTAIRFHDLRKNPAIPAERFTLTIPDGVTVVDDRPAS